MANGFPWTSALDPTPRHNYTVTNSADAPLSIETICETVERIWAEPYFLGTLFGEIVWLDRPSRTLYYNGPIQRVEFSLDHSYIAGTALHSAALKALGETS